jgi:hypothetical protein
LQVQAMTESRRLAVFLEEAIHREDVPGKLRKLVVCHVVKGNKIGDELRAAVVPDPPDDDWIAATSQKIIEHATSEAATLKSGVQRYVVQALFEGDDRPHGRHVFSIDGAEDLESSIDTDGPDADGLVGQSQKLTMFFAREYGRTGIQRERMLLEENQQLRRECADLRAEGVKRFKLLEELSSRKHERDLEQAHATAHEKRLNRSIETLEMMVPMAVNHFTGRKLLPEHAPEALLLKQLAEKVTPDQFAQCAAVLGPELAATLFHLMSMVAKPAEAAPKPNGTTASSSAGASA